jgi:hypothetical protein
VSKISLFFGRISTLIDDGSSYEYTCQALPYQPNIRAWPKQKISRNSTQNLWPGIIASNCTETAVLASNELLFSVS